MGDGAAPISCLGGFWDGVSIGIWLSRARSLASINSSPTILQSGLPPPISVFTSTYIVVSTEKRGYSGRPPSPNRQSTGSTNKLPFSLQGRRSLLGSYLTPLNSSPSFAPPR